MPADFIAETDGSGRVVWVWRMGRGDKIARPVTDPTSCLIELETAVFSGADAGAISEWFRHQPVTERQLN